MPPLTQDAIDTLTNFFQFVDTDKDGFITANEIRVACAVDINGDGQIDESEVARSAEPWLNLYLQKQDKDGDQKISLNELLEFNAFA